MVSGFKMGSLLGPETRLMSLGHSDLPTWCNPASYAVTEQQSRVRVHPLTSGRYSRYKRSCLLDACLA